MDRQSYLEAAAVFRSVLVNDISRTQLVPLRGEGGFFGPEFVPPPGSPPADVLAGFLGRSF
jgi:hypothetical protein